VGNVAGVFVSLGFIGRDNEPGFFGCGDDAADGGDFFRRHAKPLAEALVGHVVAEKVSQAGMEVAGLDTFLCGHDLKVLVGEENGAGVQGRGLETRSGQLEDLSFMHDFIDPGTAFLADADAAHQGGESFIAGLGRRIEKSVGCDERLARIGDFEAIFENLDHRAGAGLREILVDERIGDEFADGHFGEHGHLFAKRRAEHLIVGEPGVDVTDEPFEAVGVTFGPHLFVERDDSGALLVMDDAKGFARETREPCWPSSSRPPCRRRLRAS